MTLRALIVGESWGANEAQYKHALVGASGHELVRLLSTVGLAPPLPGKFPPPERMIEYWASLLTTHQIAVTNVFNARPPGNEVELFFDSKGLRTMPALAKGKYLLPEHLHHVERLWQEIRDARPNLIIAFGNAACWATLGKTGIRDLRGYVNYSKADLAPQGSNLPYIKVMPTYHPASIMRMWSNRTLLLKDLEKAAREIEFPEVRRVTQWLVAHDTETLSAPRMTLSEIRQWLNRPATEYAIDIESGYALFSALELKKMTPAMRRTLSSQISMVGFARSASDALVIPIMERNERDLCYWSRADEIEVWRLIKRGVQRPIPKIYQNGLYDCARFIEAGIYPTMCHEDTMLRHHAMYPEMLKGLGFLGSLYTEQVAWKSVYHDRESFKRDE